MYRFRQIATLLGLLFALSAMAQEPQLPVQHYVADIELQSAADLAELLGRAEQLLLEGKIGRDDEPAVTLVLHGPVLRSLLRPNYVASKDLVDRAASLTALGVVEFKACRAWMGENGVSPEELQPFVQVVSLGVAEVDRLVTDQGYIYF